MNILYLFVVVVIAALMAGAGVFIARRERAEVEFIFPKRTLNTLSSIATLVASAAGVWILFTPVETTIQFGVIALGGYALGQALPLILIAILGVRVLRLMPQTTSLPQWAQERYGKRMASAVLVICLFYMFIFLTAELTAIGKAVSVLAQIPLSITVPIIAVATWAYTNRGGFRAVVFTDKIQLSILVPLLILIFLFVLLQTKEAPEVTLRTTYLPGWTFALTLIIAIVAAQLFNQSLWQRAYACRNDKTLRISFFIAGLAMVPLIFLAGSFGFLIGDLSPRHPETAMFELMNSLAPIWLILLLLILAVLLVMSSLDSLLNALAGLIVQPLLSQRNSPTASASKVIGISRWATSIITILAILVAVPGYSVLYLFLVADMLCAGMAFPLFYGLYNKKINEVGALFGCIGGIAAGILFMPKPDFSPLIVHPLGSGWLESFLAASLVSCLLTLCITRFSRPS